jgi:hypothetical protein
VSELLAAAKEICDWLDGQRFRACIIGGLAVQRWGEPRLTRDVDLTVMAKIGNDEPIADDGRTNASACAAAREMLSEHRGKQSRPVPSVTPLESRIRCLWSGRRSRPMMSGAHSGYAARSA